jgi:hypothetical protein
LRLGSTCGAQAPLAQSLPVAHTHSYSVPVGCGLHAPVPSERSEQHGFAPLQSELDAQEARHCWLPSPSFKHTVPGLQQLPPHGVVQVLPEVLTAVEEDVAVLVPPLPVLVPPLPVLVPVLPCDAVAEGAPPTPEPPDISHPAIARQQNEKTKR